MHRLKSLLVALIVGPNDTFYHYAVLLNGTQCIVPTGFDDIPS